MTNPSRTKKQKERKCRHGATATPNSEAASALLQRFYFWKWTNKKARRPADENTSKRERQSITVMK